MQIQRTATPPPAPPTIDALRDAVATASVDWTGLDWESTLEGLAEQIREAKRIDSEQIGSWRASDGSYVAQQHEKDLNTLRSQIDALADGDGDREEAAALAEDLAAAESAYVEERAKAAAEYGAQAVSEAESGDLKEAVRLLEQACSIEREFGDSPTWSGPLFKAKALLAAAEAAEEADAPTRTVIWLAVLSLPGGGFAWIDDDHLLPKGTRIVSIWDRGRWAEVRRKPKQVELSLDRAVDPFEGLDL